MLFYYLSVRLRVDCFGLSAVLRSYFFLMSFLGTSVCVCVHNCISNGAEWDEIVISDGHDYFKSSQTTNS